ncbi:MAG: hypothetical protein C4583_15700 [Anaerolineaceae bacterium]|nr:MAG: hypothetical protein C4583_15700 [Anaerolineaceae bacterium]
MEVALRAFGYLAFAQYIAFEDAVIYGGVCLLTDPLIYLPWITIVIIVFYAALLWRFYFAKK